MIIINRERACALTVRMLKRRKRGSERESERERDGAPPITDNLIKSDDALQLGELFTLHWVVPFEGGTATAPLSLLFLFILPIALWNMSLGRRVGSIDSRSQIESETCA